MFRPLKVEPAAESNNWSQNNLTKSLLNRASDAQLRNQNNFTFELRMFDVPARDKFLFSHTHARTKTHTNTGLGVFCLTLTLESLFSKPPAGTEKEREKEKISCTTFHFLSSEM